MIEKEQWPNNFQICILGLSRLGMGTMLKQGFCGAASEAKSSF